MRFAAIVLCLWLASLMALPTWADEDLNAHSASRFADLALECVHREYPNKISHVLNSDQDVQPPRKLTPAFFGCFDWHSSVHGHWLLARLAKTYPDQDFSAQAREALAKSLSSDRLYAEAEYLDGDGRGSFERPYGLAWLLQLAAELRQWDDAQATRWSENLAPLERAARERLFTWLPKLAYPIRVGEHSQTAFAFGLILDWARIAGDAEMAALVESKAREFYLGDRNCPLSYEPSGQDFLSPCLAEADLIRRLMSPEKFADWLTGFLPALPTDGSVDWLPVGRVTDRSDGKLAHLDGLNISRAWMLEGVAQGLPVNDARRASVQATADVHGVAGLSAVTGEFYAGGHWLGSFATYLVTERGLH